LIEWGITKEMSDIINFSTAKEKNKPLLDIARILDARGRRSEYINMVTQPSTSKSGKRPVFDLKDLNKVLERLQANEPTSQTPSKRGRSQVRSKSHVRSKSQDQTS
jgi:RNA polymerase-interacting CarD/CdnL/TRCF family regulator